MVETGAQIGVPAVSPRILVLSKTTRGVKRGDKMNECVLDKIGSGPILRRHMAWREMIFFGHDMRTYSTDRKTGDAGEDGTQAAKGFQNIIYRNKTEQSWIWRRLNYWRLIAKDGVQIRVTAAT